MREITLTVDDLEAALDDLRDVADLARMSNRCIAERLLQRLGAAPERATGKIYGTLRLRGYDYLLVELPRQRVRVRIHHSEVDAFELGQRVEVKVERKHQKEEGS